MKVIILAAGKGRRLGALQNPKPLTPLINGQTILGLQIEALKKHFSLHDILVVVGHKKELIMEAFPDLLYVFSPGYETENTSKSLLRALYKVNEDVLFLNGDVVFPNELLNDLTRSEKALMVVDEKPVGKEEVKYDLNPDGTFKHISKEVKGAKGEALGINLILKTELALLRSTLEACLPNDYFEKGIELAIQQGLKIYPYVIAKDGCVEIDFPEDLERANKLICSWKK